MIDQAAKEIIQLRRATTSDTLQDIADDYGVTRERIRQICAEVGVGPPIRAAVYRRVFQGLAGAARKAVAAAEPGDAAYPHGTVRGYQRGCHCERCTRANTVRCRVNQRKRRRSTPFHCEVCKEPVWRHNMGGNWRHWKKSDHDPVPVYGTSDVTLDTNVSV